MPKPKVLALVLAGGEQYRLQSLNHRLDDGEVLARHRERRAGVTVVTSEVPADEASRQAVVEVRGDRRITGFHYKPEDPPTTRVATEVFAFRPDRLIDTLDELAAG